MAHSAEALYKARFLAKSTASETVACRGPQSTATPSPTWSYVSIGFITDLPPCSSPDCQRACSVVVFMDRLSRLARFLPIPESPSEYEVATLFTTQVQGRSGPPKSLIWDRDPEPLIDDRAREFWRKLCLLLHVPGASLPSTGADVGRVNNSVSTNSHPSLLPLAAAASRRILEQLIRNHAQYLPDTWATFLPLAEAAYNGMHYSTTGSAVAPLLARLSAGRLIASAPGSPCASLELGSGARLTATAAISSAVPSPISQPSGAGNVSQQLQLRDIHQRAQQELQAARARYNVVQQNKCTMNSPSNSNSSNSSSNMSILSGISILSSNTSSSSSNGIINGMIRERTFSFTGSSNSSIRERTCSGSGSSIGISSISSTCQSEMHCPDARFCVGDQVRLTITGFILPDQSTARLPPGGCVGPFTVVGIVSPAAYRLELPPSLGRLHPVFHISRLLPWTEPDGQSPPPAFLPFSAAAAAEMARCTPVPEPPAGKDPERPFYGAGDVVTGVRVSQTGRMLPTVMFHIRWATPRRDGRRDGWEPYAAVEQLPAVREYLRSSEWREWKRSDVAQRFLARWPERMPRLVRFEV